MYHSITGRHPRILFLIISLITLVVLVELSTGPVTSARSLSSPLRLRLRVERNTLRLGDATKVIVEFLDRDYQQAPNDRARVIQFDQSSAGSQQAGAGEISPPRITIGPGAWSAETTFVSRQTGKLFITASSEGLNSAQILVLIIRSQASFLSWLLEPVAYAADFTNRVEIAPKKLFSHVPANSISPAKLFVSVTQPPPPGEHQIIRITTSPAATVRYKGRPSYYQAEITLEGGSGASDEIDILSNSPGSVHVSAELRPSGAEDHVDVRFDSPRPSKITFDDEPQKIWSYACELVPLTVKLVDQDGVETVSDQDQHIHLRSGTDSDLLAFEPNTLALPRNRSSAQAGFRLTGLPRDNEIKLVAEDVNRILLTGQKNIAVQSPIEKVLVTGPTEINRGGAVAEFTIHLADKDGKHRAADWNRKIDLSVDGGELLQTQVTIPKGEEHASVKYTSPGSVGRFAVTAESSGLESGKCEIRVITPTYWLVLAALLGGVIGGGARQVHKGYKFRRILPKRAGGRWDFGLAGRVSGSVVSGLFLYFTIKLGLASSARLPSALDPGTKIVAFFFGGIGGFAGLVVLDRLVEWCFALLRWSKPARRKAAIHGHHLTPGSHPTSASVKTPSVHF